MPPQREHRISPCGLDEAERINPFQVLPNLNDHAPTRSEAPGSEGALAELALATATMAWWTRWQPLAIHAALRAGTSVAEVALASGPA